MRDLARLMRNTCVPTALPFLTRDTSSPLPVYRQMAQRSLGSQVNGTVRPQICLKLVQPTSHG